MAEGQDVVGVPKAQLEQLVEQARAYQDIAKQQEAPTGNPKIKSPEPKKSIGERAEELKQRTVNLTKSIDGFVGDALKYGTASFTAGSALPMMLIHPLAGLVYTTVAGSTAYIATNLAYNLLTGSVGVAYNTLRHPINTIGNLTKIIGSVVAHPGETIKNIFAAPEKIFNYLFNGRNSNKYGKFLGGLIGGSMAFKSFAPELFGKAATVAGDTLLSLKEGASLVYDKALAAVEAGKGAVSDYYWNQLFVNNPVEVAAESLKNKYHSFGFQH